MGNKSVFYEAALTTTAKKPFIMRSPAPSSRVGSRTCPGIDTVDGWTDGQPKALLGKKTTVPRPAQPPTQDHQKLRQPVTPWLLHRGFGDSSPEGPLAGEVQPAEVAGSFSAIPAQHGHRQPQNPPG